MEKEAVSIDSYLSFTLADEIFAAKVTKVKEILELNRITRVPHAPPYMKGVINLRGEVLPVIDARIRFGLGQVSATVDSCIMVLSLEIDNEQINVGALVDSVQEVFEIEESKILQPPTLGNKYKSEFLTGMYKLNDQFIMLIDMNKVFTSDDLNILQDSAAESIEN